MSRYMSATSIQLTTHKIKILENVLFYGRCSYYPIVEWLLITHAHIPTQHMLIFTTRMGNMSMFWRLNIELIIV